jgi:hypothetical protein
VSLFADMDRVSVHDPANGRWMLGRQECG